MAKVIGCTIISNFNAKLDETTSVLEYDACLVFIYANRNILPFTLAKFIDF